MLIFILNPNYVKEKNTNFEFKIQLLDSRKKLK